MRIFIFLFLSMLSSICRAQSVDSKNGFVWETNDKKIKDVELKFRTTGINLGGAEGTSAIIKNLKDENIYIQLKIAITDLCGTQTSRTINLSVKANSTLGGNTWMGGLEQWDFDSKCSSKKEYKTGKLTKISKVDMEILSMKTEEKTDFDDKMDSLAININKRKGANGKTNSIVRIKNNHIGKSVMLYVVADGKVIYEPAFLQSGGTITVGAGSAEKVSYHAVWMSPEDAKEPGITERFKKWVHGQVKAKPGVKGVEQTKKIFIPCLCVRG